MAKTVSVRIDERLHAQARKIAKADGRSIRWLLEVWILAGITGASVTINRQKKADKYPREL